MPHGQALGKEASRIETLTDGFYLAPDTLTFTHSPRWRFWPSRFRCARHPECALEAGPGRSALGRNEMLSPLKIGTVLLQSGTFIPDSICVQKEIFCPGWQSITNVNGDDLDRRIRGKGWNFFFLCGEGGPTLRRAAASTSNRTTV